MQRVSTLPRPVTKPLGQQWRDWQRSRVHAFSPTTCADDLDDDLEHRLAGLGGVAATRTSATRITNAVVAVTFRALALAFAFADPSDSTEVTILAFEYFLLLAFEVFQWKEWIKEVRAVRDSIRQFRVRCRQLRRQVHSGPTAEVSPCFICLMTWATSGLTRKRCQVPRAQRIQALRNGEPLRKLFETYANAVRGYEAKALKSINDRRHDCASNPRCCPRCTARSSRADARIHPTQFAEQQAEIVRLTRMWAVIKVARRILSGIASGRAIHHSADLYS